MTGPLDRLDRILADLPARIENARQQAAEFAARQFPAGSADGSVTATVDGTGQLKGIGFSAVAVRRMDNLTLGERVAEAVNRALDAADEARDELVAAQVPADDTAGAEELFAHRLDEWERTLDSVESRLRDLPG